MLSASYSPVSPQNKKNVLASFFSFESGTSQKNKDLPPSDRELKADRPGNLAFEISLKRKILEILALVASGLFYATAFPPLNFSAVAWFALIPLFFLVRSKTPSKAFLYGFIWGYSFSCASYFWLREIEIFIPFVFSLILALFPASWALAVPFCRRYIFVPLDIQLKGYAAEKSFLSAPQGAIKEILLCTALASCWVSFEWLRTWIMTGFPWNLIAVSQWKNPALLQICEYTGIYGLSFELVFFNIALALFIPVLANCFRGAKYVRPFPLMTSIALVMASVLIGVGSIPKEVRNSDIVPLNVALVQGDIEQCRIPTDEQSRGALDKYLHLSDLALSSSPDLVIWPETAVPVPLRSSCEIGNEFRRRLFEMIKNSKTPFLIGTIEFGDILPGEAVENIPIHNSSVLVHPSLAPQKYHKIHIVPFGEYTPFGEYYPGLIQYFGMGRSLTPGRGSSLIEVKPGVYAGVNICYESIFPEISRMHVLAGANVLIVQTNDAWYPKSSEPEQHLAHAVFRAVENRRPLIRCGNNSGTCVISPYGAIEESISSRFDEKIGAEVPTPWHKTDGFGVFTVKVPNPPKLSFYTAHGDLFAHICVLISISTLAYCLFAWKNKKAYYDKQMP